MVTHRTFRITLAQIVGLLGRGWVWGSTLASPGRRRQWTVRIVGPGRLQLEPVFGGGLALRQPPEN